MQRKNHLLESTLTPTMASGKLFLGKKVPSRQRKAFAMIMAIIVIVVISTIMALSLAMTAETGKRTTDLYLYEQSVLYSKSAAELALLDIAQGGPCTTIPTYTIDGIYDINVSVRYIYKGTTCGAPNDYFTTITTDEQNGSVLMDITVRVDPSQTLGEPITYFRRTIQKL